MQNSLCRRATVRKTAWVQLVLTVLGAAGGRFPASPRSPSLCLELALPSRPLGNFPGSAGHGSPTAHMQSYRTDSKRLLQHSESSKPVPIRTYLHERSQKTKTNMYEFAPPRLHLWAPNRNKPTQIRTLWKTPQRRTYPRWGVQAKAPFKGIKRVRGATPPGTKNQGGNVKRGLSWPSDLVPKMDEAK